MLSLDFEILIFYNITFQAIWIIKSRSEQPQTYSLQSNSIFCIAANDYTLANKLLINFCLFNCCTTIPYVLLVVSFTTLLNELYWLSPLNNLILFVTCCLPCTIISACYLESALNSHLSNIVSSIKYFVCRLRNLYENRRYTIIISTYFLNHLIHHNHRNSPLIRLSNRK